MFVYEYDQDTQDHCFPGAYILGRWHNKHVIKWAKLFVTYHQYNGESHSRNIEKGNCGQIIMTKPEVIGNMWQVSRGQITCHGKGFRVYPHCSEEHLRAVSKQEGGLFQFIFVNGCGEGTIGRSQGKHRGQWDCCRDSGGRWCLGWGGKC